MRNPLLNDAATSARVRPTYVARDEDDDVGGVSPAIIGCGRSLAPVEVLRHTGAKWPHSIEDLARHPHIGGAGEAELFDVTLEIECKNNFERLDGGRLRRVLNLYVDAATDKIDVGIGEGGQTALQPVGGRTAI